MKKIKNIKQLGKQKRLLQQRETELLQKINSGWRHLKENLHPQNYIIEQVRKCKEENSGLAYDENIFKTVLSFGASLLVKKIVKRTEESLKKYFN
jgi:hypothetical protein